VVETAGVGKLIVPAKTFLAGQLGRSPLRPFNPDGRRRGSC